MNAFAFGRKQEHQTTRLGETRMSAFEHKTIATYFAPNKTIRELNELIMTGVGIDPLKEFGEVAREELPAFCRCDLLMIGPIEFAQADLRDL
jgi:hypothetical protein